MVADAWQQMLDEGVAESRVDLVREPTHSRARVSQTLGRAAPQFTFSPEDRGTVRCHAGFRLAVLCLVALQPTIQRSEAELPFADGLVRDIEAARDEHLGDVAEAQFAARSRQHGERCNVDGVFENVAWARSAR